ncbi:hypothetical protein QTO30_12450 [Yoonia sp. GPGPB17]|uniref:hypothetical protein n=1 Tax=Yoonia sp. GPGPB17 TaxID=3026147 RepID=UPI0030C16816
MSCADPKPHVFSTEAPIEYHYSQTGRYAAEVIEIATQGQAGHLRAYIPVGRQSERPVVVLQNGTGVDIDTYDALARHLASWGLIVVGSYDQQMGSGAAGIAILHNLQEWATLPGHPLNGRIDVDNIAMAGSSQGAVGTINAHTRFAEGRTIKALAIHGLPTRQAIDFFGLDLSYDVAGVTAPIFVMTGTEDEFISPIALNQASFNAMTYANLRVLGVAQDATHIEFADDGGRMKGYLTAWMLYRLTQDSYAAQAFEEPAEITLNPSWSIANVH